jgi:hypothetical protein
VPQIPEMPKNPGLLSDLIQFMKENKKWWLIPIVAAVLLMGALIALGATSAAPFIYTLF